jgi:hypothetical protein
MKKYIAKARQNRAAKKKLSIKTTRIESGMINGIPCLMCEGKVIINTYTSRMDVTNYGRHRCEMSLDVDFIEGR